MVVKTLTGIYTTTLWTMQKKHIERKQLSRKKISLLCTSTKIPLATINHGDNTVFERHCP